MFKSTTLKKTISVLGALMTALMIASGSAYAACTANVDVGGNSIQNFNAKIINTNSPTASDSGSVVLATGNVTLPSAPEDGLNFLIINTTTAALTLTGGVVNSAGGLTSIGAEQYSAATVIANNGSYYAMGLLE